MKKLYRFLINTLPRPLLIRLSYVFKIFAPYLYRGNNVECVVCKHTFSKFLGYGSDRAARENVLCPYCLTLERHRLLWLYLQEKTDFFTQPKKMLHIAPEQCFHAIFKKQKNLDYLTADLESPIADMHFDLHQIPLEDNTFDVIFCNHVLEHVEDDHQCMKELFRVLKPGGMAVLQVPIDYTREKTYEDSSIVSPKAREEAFWQKDHVRLYGLDYPKRLEQAGFIVEVANFAEQLGKEKCERYRIIPHEKLYIGKK
jgi:SAM-dependent methyltransferase